MAEAKERNARSSGDLLCSPCERTFSSALSLSEHRALHERRSPYACPVCGRPFRQNAGLWRHLRTHAEKRPPRPAFPCDACGRSFSRPDYLRSHAKAHTGGERAHVCEVCGKGFHQRSDLKRHAPTHGEERPFACALCARTFADRSTRNRHQREHASFKKHSCVTCGAAFKRAAKLREHVSRRHPDGTSASSTLDTLPPDPGSTEGDRRVHDFVERPDFSSQEYYDWLASFATACDLLPMPLEGVVFERVTRTAKCLQDALASPSGVLASRHNFHVLVGISEDLGRVAARHLALVAERLP